MVKVLLSGANGKMGRVIAESISNRDTCEIVCGVDISDSGNHPFPIYKNANSVTEEVDVIIDFSHPSALGDILDFAVQRKIPAVIATTGMCKEHIDLINEAAQSVPVFFTYNMSLGVNLLADLAKRAAAVLSDDFDIEIVEAHHNQKIDAPSGTAIMLADAICDAVPNQNFVFEYDRHSKRVKRQKNEIGFHSIRGGTITGEHEIIFAGTDELVKLSHSAGSKNIFAVGSVNAALFLVGKSEGIYNMTDLIASI